MDNKQIIRKFVKDVRKRLGSINIFNTCLFTFAIGAGIGAFILMLSMLIPMYYAPHVSIALVIISLAAGLIWGLIKYPDMKTVAIIADSKGLDEKVITGYELIKKDGAFEEIQRKEAAEAIKDYDIRENIPFNINSVSLIISIFTLALFVTFLFAPSKAKDAAKANHQLALVKKQVEKEIDKTIKKIDEVSNDLEAKEMKEALEQAKKEIKESNTAKDVSKALERMEQKMDQHMEKAKSEIKEKTESNDGKNDKNADKQKSALDKINEARNNMAKHL